MIEDLVSIIIVNYNTEKFLEDCLISIEKHTIGVNYEVIVVDNDSEKGSLSDLISRYKNVTFLLTQKNSGFGIANNIGAKEAKGKYLFFLNPDTLLLNDAISILYRYMEDNPKVGVCGGNIYNEDMSPGVSYFDIDRLWQEYKMIFNGKHLSGFNHTGEPQEVLGIVGADLFIRNNLFNEFNGFDPDFFMYFEEEELCHRICKKKHKIMSVPDAHIIHLQGVAAENKNEQLKKWSYKEHNYSKFLFFYKTKGLLHTQLVHSLYYSKLMLASLLYSVSSNKEKLEYWNLKRVVISEAFARYRKYISHKP